MKLEMGYEWNFDTTAVSLFVLVLFSGLVPLNNTKRLSSFMTLGHDLIYRSSKAYIVEKLTPRGGHNKYVVIRTISKSLKKA